MNQMCNLLQHCVQLSFPIREKRFRAGKDQAGLTTLTERNQHRTSLLSGEKSPSTQEIFEIPIWGLSLLGSGKALFRARQGPLLGIEWYNEKGRVLLPRRWRRDVPGEKS